MARWMSWSLLDRGRHILRRGVTAIALLLLGGILLRIPVSAMGEEGPRQSIVYQGQDEERTIALTFDDGPHPQYTAEILDILAEYRVSATFFVIGENVEQYPALLERAVSEGHEIGNHTQTHPLRNLPREQMEEEISACERTVGEWIDRRPHLFRPPGGIISQTVMTLAEDHSYRVILWSIDTRDWAHTPVEKIVQTVTDEVGAGDIILMHDGIDAPSPTPAALRILIPSLLSQGYRFVTVSELLGEG